MNDIIKGIITIFVFIFVIIMCFVILNIPHITGLSDNGDFARLTEQTNISLVENEELAGSANYFFKNIYIMKLEGKTNTEIFFNLFKQNTDSIHEYTSSQISFVNLSKVLNFISNNINDNDLEIYNISLLSIIYILILAFAFLLLYKSFETDNIIKNILIFGIIGIVFLDLGYIIYFNSFYGEALQYCSFILINAILFYTIHCYKEERKLSTLNYFLFFIFFLFTYIFGTSKSANVPIGIIYSITGCIICLLCTKNTYKVVFTIITIASIIFSIIGFSNTPKWMINATNYNSVFYGILKGSKNPDKDLFDLDINQRYISLSNTTAYNSEYKYDISSNKFEENVYDNISKSKILKYYLLHPTHFFEKVNISLENAKIIKPMYLGNYLYEDNDIKMSQNTNYSLWSNFRNDINITNIYIFIAFSLLVVSLLIIAFYRFFKYTINSPLKITMLYSSHILELIVFTALFLSLLISLIIPFMSNGEADLQKHMFLFNNIYDLMLVCIVIYIITYIPNFINYLKRHKTQRIISIAVFLSIIISGILFANTKQTNNVKEITFGTYNNKNIVWQVIDETQDSYLLITKEPLVESKFDEDNSNYWINSSIRKLLNEDLYNSFTKEEKSKIIQNSSKVLLAQDYATQKDKGVLPYYWSPYPNLQDSDTSRYYQTTSNDYVFLLNSFEYDKYITKNKITTKENMVFMTPYVNNYNMVRYIGEYGNIYINDANILYNIYPSIWIKK